MFSHKLSNVSLLLLLVGFRLTYCFRFHFRPRCSKLPSVFERALIQYRVSQVNCAIFLQNAEDIKESASMLIQDNLKNQQQIHTRRQQEKEQVEERLKQKLREKNHQHQLRRENVDRS